MSGPDVPTKPKSGASRATYVVILVLILFLLASIAAVFFLLWFRKTEPAVCMTPGCIHTASLILNSMSTEVDPCTDFYEYACGKWVKKHPIPDDAPSVSNFENLSQDLELALKELLEKQYVAAIDGDAVRKAKSFYSMCLNESEITGTWRKVFDEVRHEFGGWPSLDEPGPTNVPSIERLYGIMVAKFRVDSLFKATVQPDDKNSEKHILLIDQPQLNLFARDFYMLYETEDERLGYKTLIRDVLVLLNADSRIAERDSTEILAFETELANITVSEDQRHDISELYTKWTIGQMRREFRNFDWLLFFNTIFEGIRDKNGSIIRFDESTEVVIYGVDFVQRFDQLIPQFDRRIVVNYLSWCWFFKAMLRDLPDPFALTMFKFYRTLNLMMVQKLRWHGCVSRINSIMPMATSSLYIRKNFDHEAKAQVEEMIGLIMEAFVELLEEEDWLTDETKAFAKEKVHTMNQKIGYPDYLNDSKAVDKEYNRYVLYPGDYYRTKFQFYEMYQVDILERIRMPVDRERWVAGAALVNAFYSPNTNEIIFPAGILQPVFYNKDFPRSMNYGGIGVVIGHEITHGFDDRGRLYDNLGNIRQWWDQQTIDKFEEKAHCIEEQYSNYVLDQISMRINGRSTKGENIADNGGLKQAYRAYKKYERYHPLPQQLPGVNLTQDQLFFLNYAQIWCGVMNDKEAIRKLRTSEHSPGPIRVKGPLSNSVDFAAAYQCKPGSPMNPIRKCRVW
ncbi:Phosphate-regulating neutral endopeptidase [Aphelenchoides besseyi]|nr:Phosphate-regulating neutral endopeptidase [Aphelenchoides besseyi]KAI6194019.1 Phosphate-regulating neutral endopeptidase [Aphelenchoides besseyi]